MLMKCQLTNDAHPEITGNPKHKAFLLNGKIHLLPDPGLARLARLARAAADQSTAKPSTRKATGKLAPTGSPFLSLKGKTVVVQQSHSSRSA